MEGQTTQWPKKGQKDEQTVYKTLHRKLKIEQHELHKTTGVNAGATEGEAVPRTLTLAYLYVWIYNASLYKKKSLAIAVTSRDLSSWYRKLSSMSVVDTNASFGYVGINQRHNSL